MYQVKRTFPGHSSRTVWETKSMISAFACAQVSQELQSKPETGFEVLSEDGLSYQEGLLRDTWNALLHAAITQHRQAGCPCTEIAYPLVPPYGKGASYRTVVCRSCGEWLTEGWKE